MTTVICLRAEKITELLFFSPIIYDPLLKLAEKDELLAKNRGNPLQGEVNYSIKGVIAISTVENPGVDKTDYDQMFSLSFSLFPQIKYAIYAKNKNIVKLVKKVDDLEESYIRNQQFNGLVSDSRDYKHLSIKLLSEVFEMEDMFPFIMAQHPNYRTINFEVVHFHKNPPPNDNVSIAIYFPALSMVKHFSLQNGDIWNSSYHITGKDCLMSFAMTTYLNFATNKRYIGEASIFKTNGADGFSCHFFSNGALKDYVIKKSNKWEKQDVWNETGAKVGEYPFPPGLIIKKEDEPHEYFPNDLLSEIVSLNKYHKLSASYWDIPTKSPCYKLALSTQKGIFLASFMFSNNNELLKQQYEKLRKEKEEKIDSTHIESPVYFETPIGEFSCGITKNHLTTEMFFLRGNVLLTLRSSDGKDVKQFAYELDKALNKSLKK